MDLEHGRVIVSGSNSQILQKISDYLHNEEVILTEKELPYFYNLSQVLEVKTLIGVSYTEFKKFFSAEQIDS